MKRSQQKEMAIAYITLFQSIEKAVDKALRESQGNITAFRDAIEEMREDFRELQAMKTLLCSDGNVDRVLYSCGCRYDLDRRLYIAPKRKTLEEVRALRKEYMKRYNQTERGREVRINAQKRYREKRKEEARLADWNDSANIQLTL